MDPASAIITGIGGIIQGVVGFFTTREKAEAERETAEAEAAAQRRQIEAELTAQRETYEHQLEMTRENAYNQAQMFANIMRFGALAGGFVLLYTLIK